MRLIIEDDSGRRSVVPFTEDQISIGRERGNTVRLEERNVSRRHAILTRQDGRVVIEDLGSSNGVQINGDRIRGKLEVGEGDVIRIGDYDLALEDETKASPPERPTQPELGANPAPVGSDELGDELEALARMQKAAALHAALTKEKEKPRAVERDTDPKRNAVDPDAPWPPDFHRFEPEAMKAARAKASRRRILRVALPVVLAGAATVFLLQWRATRPKAQVTDSDLIQDPIPRRPEPAPAPAPAAMPPPAGDAPVAAPAAMKAAPSPRSPAAQPPAARPSRTAAREKAHDLYQDAVADVGNGDYPGAMSKLQEALRLDPASPEAHKELAICYSHLNQPDKGALHYQRYLELAPQAADADDVRKMLSDYRSAKGR